MTNLPKSAVSNGSGLCGVVVMTALLALALVGDLEPFPATMLIMGGTAAACVIWDVVIDKVHLRPTTGLDYAAPRPLRDIGGIVAIKTVGLFATIGLLGLVYLLVPTYGADKFGFFFALSRRVLPLFLALAPIYILLTTRYMVDPRDKLWQFGRFLTGGRREADLAEVKDHLLGWAIKGFFLAFLVSIIPPIFGGILEADLGQVTAGPVPFLLFAVRLMFLYDVCFGTFGYVMTFRPLDSHIRSANPHLSAWVAALICYPPFVLMSQGGPLDYHTEVKDWVFWLDGMPAALVIWGTALVMLTFLYAWATAVFGIRFSNLTNRGIITSGPYRYFKHPAYLSKNIFWWLSTLPFLTMAEDPMTGVRNAVLLAAVNAVYFLRAKTEEKHLMADPDYRAYADWIAVNGVIPRALRRMRLAPAGAVQVPAE